MIKPDDPRLTAYVLGELSESERQQIQSEIDGSPELQEVVCEIHEVTSVLTSEYRASAVVGLRDEQKQAIHKVGATERVDVIQPRPDASQTSFWLKNWAWFVVAACLVIMAIPLLQKTGELQTAQNEKTTTSSSADPSETLGDVSFDDSLPVDQLSVEYDSSDPFPNQHVAVEDAQGQIIDGKQLNRGGKFFVDSDGRRPQRDADSGMYDVLESMDPSASDSTSTELVTSVNTTPLPDSSSDGAEVRLNQLSVTPAIIVGEEEEERLLGERVRDGFDRSRDQAESLRSSQVEREKRLSNALFSEGLEATAQRGARDSLPEDHEAAEVSSLASPASRPANGSASELARELVAEDELGSVVDQEVSDAFRVDVAGKDITTRFASDLLLLNRQEAKLEQDPPEADSKRMKSWKRVKAIPNTSRLMIGDHEELDMNGMQVRVQVDGFRARVLVDCFYYNDRNQQLEGKFKLRLPDDASLYYFAFGQSAFDLTRNGKLTQNEFIDPLTTRFVALKPSRIKQDRGDVWRNVKESRMVPREKAAYAYSQTVRRRVDPALVEWSGAGVFNASVFPLMPKKLHRIVIGYDVDLQRTANGLTYNLDLPTSVKQCKVDIDVRELNGATVALDTDAKYRESTNEGVRRFHIDEPRSEASKGIGLTIAGGHDAVLVSRDEEAGNFFATRTILDLPQDDSTGSQRALFLVDTSLSSRPDKFNVWLQMLEATLANNRNSLEEFAVVFFDVESRFWRDTYVKNTDENVKSLLDDCQQIVLEGATDLFAAVKLVNKSEWVTANHTPDVFLLSDGAVNWGEANLRLIQREFASGKLGSLFAYQTGMTGTSIANLRFLASESGGAVFSVASENEVTHASTAHRARPWRLESINLDGARDILTAGRVQWVYPGQMITTVGRLEDGAEMADLEFVLQRGSDTKKVKVRPPELVESNLASRVYGHVAVGQLESLDRAELDVTTAYARHFRITGDTCSLLMLESDADYKRFDIKPEEDEFVVRTTNAAEIVQQTIDERSEELGDPKVQLLTWIQRLENMPGMNFELPTALRLALKQIDVEPVYDSLQEDPTEIPSDYAEHLVVENLNYGTVLAEAQRRGQNSSARAVKVLSSLIEHNPGDLVLARDVAFTSMEMSRPAQAYHLLRRVADARPYDPSVYTALGQCLTQMDKADMAIVFYEIAIGGNFQNRSHDFRKIAGTEYAFLLRQIASGERDSKIKSYAEARLDTIGDKCKIETQADLLITMMWNTDQTDVDLHVVEPTGEECFYSHPKTRAGGHITRDITDGFGPEMYAIKKAPAGRYNVWVKYFNTNPNRVGMRSKVYLTIYRDFGTGAETVTRQVVNITKPGQKERVETVTLK